MYSLPQETEKDLNLTLDLMDELDFYSSKIHCYDGFTRIYPGTQLEILAKKQGKIPVDFNWYKKIQPPIPLYENKILPLRKIEEIVRKRKQQRIKRENLFSLIRKGVKLFLRVRSFKDIKSLIKKFIELRIKKI